jgi:hypothetical protein
MTRLVYEHDQPHIRSPFATAAPISRLRRATAQEDVTILIFGASAGMVLLASKVRGWQNIGHIKVGIDGHFVGYEPLVCADDVEAIIKAKRLVDGHEVELWRAKGSLSGSVAKQSKTASGRELPGRYPVSSWRGHTQPSCEGYGYSPNRSIGRFARLGSRVLSHLRECCQP